MHMTGRGETCSLYVGYSACRQINTLYCYYLFFI